MSSVEENGSVWYRESTCDGVDQMIKVKKVMFKGASSFQKVEIVDTEPYGKALFLDKQIQSSLIDECVYHESLVHPAMLCHPNPKRVFIGGGGEGGTLREVLRHKSVEECVMVDIDPVAVEMSKQHLGEWHQGAFDSPRTKLVLDDAKKILEQYPADSFDVIIMDLSDPLDYGPCYKLYSAEFYATCKDKLTEQGVFVTQSGPGGILNVNEVWSPVYNTLKAGFAHTHAYNVNVPSFMQNWAYVMAGKAEEQKDAACLSIHSINRAEPGKVDELLQSRELEPQMKHYDGFTHTKMFSLTKRERTLMAADDRIISEKNPIYVCYETSEIAPDTHST